MTPAEVGALIDGWTAASAAARSTGAWEPVGKAHAAVVAALARHGPVDWRGERWAVSNYGMLLVWPVPAEKVAGYCGKQHW